MLPGKLFLWWRAVLLSHFPESPLWFGNGVRSIWFFFKVLETGWRLLGVSPVNRVAGAQRMSDVSPDNCGRGSTAEPAQCRRATSKSGFPEIQASSGAQQPSNVVKTSWYNCLPSDYVVLINDGQCLPNQKTQPTLPWSLTESSRKILRPATSTQVFLGFPVSISKCSDGSQHSKLPLHASHVALRT